jgi:hypothetical protein
MNPYSVWRTLRSILWLAPSLLLTPLALQAAAAPGVGSYAPPLELADLAGAARNVAWGDGSPAATIVYFGLAVYAVEARGRQPAEVTRSLERYCLVYRDPAFPILADPAFRAGRTYGAEQVPVTFIMESHGVILNRIEGYGFSDAVVIARRIEQLLRRERGYFSPVLRESGISEAEEQEVEARLTDAVAARASAPAARPAMSVNSSSGA